MGKNIEKIIANNEVDIKENLIYKLDKKLLEILLKDRSSKKNIIWATDNYQSKGNGYYEYQEITIPSITGKFGSVIKPRIEKSKVEQEKRIKTKAEVFTPSWVCNNQNNLVDNAWFGRENVFNTENGKTWITNHDKIIFPEGKTWQDYVNSNRLEITCGEAPYLTSRYDTTTGIWLDVNERIGLLDRKIRVINENTNNEDEWLNWVYNAYKSIYGFEWQGDSLLIARENLLFTFIDYYFDRFKMIPSKEKLVEIANVISWNIFQMDGLKFVIPNSCKPIPKMQISLFDKDEELEECQGCLKDDYHNHTGIYCKVMDWEKNKSVKFIDLLKEKN